MKERMERRERERVCVCEKRNERERERETEKERERDRDGERARERLYQLHPPSLLSISGVFFFLCQYTNDWRSLPCVASLFNIYSLS